MYACARKFYVQQYKRPLRVCRACQTLNCFKDHVGLGVPLGAPTSSLGPQCGKGSTQWREI